MARLTREESQERTRGLLIEAARKAFARSGFGGASVGEIAEAAGFSKGAFYSNFESKEALLLELLRLHKTQMIEDLRAIVDGGSGIPEILRAMGERLAQGNRDADWALLAVELQLHAARSPSFAEEYEGVHCEHREALGEMIAAMFRKAGRRPQADPRVLASGFIALVQGLSLQQNSGGSGLVPELIPLFAKSLLLSAEPEGGAGSK